ncbi:hypothetical protein [Photorhabdus aballayi]|uniref:hypothetical protein n=1 Tax=Photorhabdus aballayi TaxID=2991723 RepID=UPI0035E34A5C
MKTIEARPMTTYVCVFEPTKNAQKNGAVPLAIALEANSEKMAKAMAIVYLGEEYPDNIDSFNTSKPIICEDMQGSPRPPIGKFDEKFATEYEFNGTTWQVKAIKPEPDNSNELVNFSKVATVVRIAAIMLFGTTELTKGHIRDAITFVHNDTSQPKLRDIAKGLAKINEVALMDAPRTQKIIHIVLEHFTEYVDYDSEQVTQFAIKWLSQPEKPTFHEREFGHTYSTLDIEIALALLDDNFECWSISSAHLKAAKELIATDNEAWRRWSVEFRIRTDALSIPRETIFNVIRKSKQHPEYLTDAQSRRKYLDNVLGKAPDSKLNNEPKSEPQTTSVTEQVDLETEGSETKPKTRRKRKTKQEEQTEKPQINTSLQDEKQEVTVICHNTANSNDFQDRANILDETIKTRDAEQQTNLRIWKTVQRTDPRFTKPIEGMGFIGTSINSNYMFMRATEIFGPVGEGWGYQVLEEKMINGAPLSEPIYDSQNKQIGIRILRDGDGTLICEQNHSIKILFWYLAEGDIRGEIESYGATPYLYKSRYGIKADSEVIKKSLTDAIKKALSMLGFSADVFMGMYDNPEYLADNKIEFEIKAASDKAEDLVRLRKELDDKFTRNTETMRTAVSKNEIRGIASTLTRELGIHLDNAKTKADKDYEKYLSGRLRRLTEIEKECLTKLEEEANQ